MERYTRELEKRGKASHWFRTFYLLGEKSELGKTNVTQSRSSKPREV